MVAVNPPPQPKLPKEFSNNRDISNFFKNWEIIIRQLWLRSGGATDVVSEIENIHQINLASSIFEINQRVGSGQHLTIDTSGFTIDNSQQTIDQDEA